MFKLVKYVEERKKRKENSIANLSLYDVKIFNVLF